MTGYDFRIEPGKTMSWEDGRGCDHCGARVEGIWHGFEGDGKRWSYFAPLYHNAVLGVGFCDTVCATEWTKQRYLAEKA